MVGKRSLRSASKCLACRYSGSLDEVNSAQQPSLSHPQLPVACPPSPVSGGRPTCSSPSLPNTMASWGDYQQVFIIGASPAGVLTSQNLLEAVLALQPKSGWVTENFSNRLGPFGPPPKPKGGRKASAISVKTFRSMSLRCSAT